MKNKNFSNLFVNRKKCVIYIRVSSERQVQGFSLDGQKRELIEYAKAKGLEVAEILNSLNTINRYGINLLTKEEGIDYSNNMGGLMITILGTVAEMERENIITQTMLGREEKSRQGGWCGGFAPFGYDLKDERLVKNEYSYVVETIFDKYVHENIGIKGVVDYLNKNGIKKPVPKNKEDFQFTDWSTHTIKGILDNPVYTGYIVFGRRRTVECINENTGEMEYKLRKQENRTSSPKHLLSGLLRCPECGSGMVISYNRWVNKKKNPDAPKMETRSYICGYYNRSDTYGECHRNGIHLNESKRKS